MFMSTLSWQFPKQIQKKYKYKKRETIFPAESEKPSFIL